MYFIEKFDGIRIEEYIKEVKDIWKRNWILWIYASLKYDASIWWDLLNLDKIKVL
jgi:hypothetical protein